METEDIQNPEQECKPEDKKCCKCKINCQIIINIMLAAGLIVLFILHFTGRKAQTDLGNSSGKTSFSIAFLNSDTLMTNYEYVKEIKKIMEDKQKKLEDQYVGQQTAFEREVGDFQKKVQANAYTNEQAQTIDRQLGAKQQQLAELKQTLAEQLATDEQKINATLQDTITVFLKRYNKKHNYDYIFGYAKGSSSGILFAKDAYDITKDVISEMNKEYKENSKK
jgi:outer membrane protein